MHQKRETIIFNVDFNNIKTTYAGGFLTESQAMHKFKYFLQQAIVHF